MRSVVASLKYRIVVFFPAGHTFGGFGPTRFINSGENNFGESFYLQQKSNASLFFRAETLMYLCTILKSSVYTRLAS